MTTPTLIRRVTRRLLVPFAALALGAAVLAGTAGPASAAASVPVGFTNTGCRTADLLWDSGAGLVSYGTVAPGATKTINTFPTHRWLMYVGSMKVGSYTVGGAPASKRFDSYGCYLGTGQYAVAHSGLCLNVEGAFTTPGARLLQYPCGGGGGAANERFDILSAPGGFLMRATHSGMCIGVKGGSLAAGASVVQQPCTYGGRQILSNAPAGALRFKQSGQCMDVFGGSLQVEKVIQWPCNGQANQSWFAR